ncbi:interactor of HORMAD1 protein 1 isoform X3 [Tachysurus fulvidraco]|uniref:interactor of HORMAD1 protein 1 isoform X3 n=1 Tax=Tachysurus fulvidraco TaxID=1234273 RepID=UPI001FEE38E6|nr:interactor of HORMAD1 protein 1 isoform X3 [Tachysurus fulvidraco]
MLIVQEHGTMKPNIWNVKEILNIPMNSVGAKPAKGGATAGDYSSLSDSQFLFGSQNWPENSQSFSQELCGQSRSSQQASQEINETKVSSKYQSKPMLFGDSKVTNISGGRAMGILDRFEEEKRKAKEIEILIGVRQLHESLENIQKTFLNCIDGSCDITRAAVAEGIGTFRKTIQDNFATIKESIANQTELMKSQTCREMKDNEEKTSLALKELSSLVLNLQRDLDSLKLEQSKEQSVLGEILSLLSTVMTARSAGTQPGPVQMIDNTVQTSPSLVTQFCVVSEEKRYYEGSKAFNFSGEKVDLSICPVTHTSPEKLSRGAPFRVIGTQPFQMKRDIATERCDPNGWKKSYRLHPVTVNSPNPVATFTDPAHIQDPKKDYMFGHPVHIERVNSLNDMTKNNSAAWIEVPREKKIAKRAQRCQTFRKKKRALILPQRRPDQGKVLNNVFEESQHDEDQENRVPNLVVNGYRKAIRKSVVSGKHVPLQQPSTTRLSNTNECVQNLDPCSLSQSSNSSQMIVEYQQAEWETVNPEQKANTIKTQRVTWQLFDFISDSD